MGLKFLTNSRTRVHKINRKLRSEDEVVLLLISCYGCLVHGSVYRDVEH